MAFLKRTSSSSKAREGCCDTIESLSEVFGKTQEERGKNIKPISVAFGQRHVQRLL